MELQPNFLIGGAQSRHSDQPVSRREESSSSSTSLETLAIALENFHLSFAQVDAQRASDTNDTNELISPELSKVGPESKLDRLLM